MNDWGKHLMIGVPWAVAGAALAFAFTAAPRGGGEDVRAYLLANPEVIPEAMARLEAKQAGAAVRANGAAVRTPFAGAWAGARDGDVVLVEFFDYSCPYCARSAADVRRLLAEDKRLKVVFRDFPVLGPASEQAALASLAAARAGRYVAFYDAMFTTPGRPGDAKIRAAAAAAGLDAAALASAARDPALIAEAERNFRLAQSLNINGTPAYVVGDQLLSGAVGYDALKAAIAKARAAK